MIGPTAAGFAMSAGSAESLFWVTGGAHILLVLFALLRLRARAAVAQEDKSAFRAAPLPRAATPETLAMVAEEAEAAAAANADNGTHKTGASD